MFLFMKGWNLVLIMVLIPLVYGSPYISFDATSYISYTPSIDSCSQCISETGVSSDDYFTWVFNGDHSETLRVENSLILDINNLDVFYFFSKGEVDAVQILLNEKIIVPLDSNLVLFEHQNSYYAYSLDGDFIYGSNVVEAGFILNVETGELIKGFLNRNLEVEYTALKNSFAQGYLTFTGAALEYGYQTDSLFFDANVNEIEIIDEIEVLNAYMRKLVLVKNLDELESIKINNLDEFMRVYEQYSDYINGLQSICKLELPSQIDSMDQVDLNEYLISCIDEYDIFYDDLGVDNILSGPLVFDFDTGSFYFGSNQKINFNNPLGLDKYFLMSPDLSILVNGDIYYEDKGNFLDILTNGSILFYQGLNLAPIVELKENNKLRYYKSENIYVFTEGNLIKIVQDEKLIQFPKGTSTEEILALMGLNGADVEFVESDLSFIINEDIVAAEADYFTPPARSGKKSSVDKSSLKTVGELVGDFIDETAFDDPISIDTDRLDDVKDAGSDVKSVVTQVEDRSYQYFGRFIDKIPFGDRTTKFYIFALLVIIVVLKILRK